MKNCPQRSIIYQTWCETYLAERKENDEEYKLENKENLGKKAG